MLWRLKSSLQQENMDILLPMAILEGCGVLQPPKNQPFTGFENKTDGRVFRLTCIENYAILYGARGTSSGGVCPAGCPVLQSHCSFQCGGAAPPFFLEWRMRPCLSKFAVGYDRWNLLSLTASELLPHHLL